MTTDIIQIPVRVIGSSTIGTYFRLEMGRDGALLSKIGVWAGPSELQGVRVWFTNSHIPQTFGNADSGEYKEFQFNPGERMTSLSLWGNGTGTRSGGIKFKTSQGRDFEHFMNRWSLREEFVIDVASGLCEGIRGRHHPEITALGFSFLLPITQARLTNVRYPTLALEAAGIQSVTVRDFRDENHSQTNSKQWTNSGTYTTTTTSSWSITAGVEAHSTITVSAGIPLIADVSGQFGWSVSAAGTHEISNEDDDSFNWSRSGEVPPGEWLSLIISTRQGIITLPYSATMEITLVNGARFSYPLEGLYAGVAYSRVEARMDTGNLDDRVRESRSSILASLDKISSPAKRGSSTVNARGKTGEPVTATGNDREPANEVYLEYN